MTSQISYIVTNLVEFQKAGLVTAFISTFVAILVYYLAKIQSYKKLKKMRLYPVLISASSNMLFALEPFIDNDKRENYESEIFFYLIEDSLINYQKLISGEGIIALLNNRDKNELLRIENALLYFHIKIKEISKKWSIMHSYCVRYAMERHLQEELTEDIINSIRKMETDFENSFFEIINKKFHESFNSIYSDREMQYLELLKESATKLRNVGIRGLKINESKPS